MGFKENVSVTLDISANIAQVRSAANELQNILSKSNFSSGFSSKITGMVSQLNDALSQLETKGSKAITGLGDVKGVETSIGKVSTIIRNIAVELDRAGASGSKGLLAMINGMDSKLEQASSAQKQYTKSIQETQSEADKLAKSLDKVQKAQTEAERKSNEALARSNAAKAKIQAAEQTKANLRSSSGRTADSLDSEIEAKMARIKQLQALMSDVAGGGKKLRLFETDKSSFSEDQVKQITEYQNIVSSLTGEVGRLKQEQTALNEEIAKQDEIIKKAKSEQTKADTDQQRSIEDYVKQTAAIQTVQDQIKQLNQTAKDTAAFDEYKQKLSEIFGDETLKNATSIDELNTALERLKESGIKMTADQLQKLLSISSGMGTPLKEMGEKARQAGDGFKQMTDKAQDLDMLTYRLKYFFSMVGGFQLFRRAIRSSIETIKELDAAMTQTAVVSTKTVGQMWKTLPEYTQKAKTLAASIKDVYSAQTLYVQQGLDMDSALGLGVETLKMARVAGIEAAAATDSMTAALRGFKMELNETSAVRINDVYSKLAQNTASNVQEISTAMTKVAALANSANMSFENTAAFLSKIIESTREGAETAGTALKTVIARFTEVKTLYDQGELLGTDEEGQEVDVNKISKALRTAGINMNEFFTGAKGLDEIFIELGKKWDSLTTIQQRYIATQAAGSRQQSRFLALMQDFSRTTELTQMAYNAAGSGQEQFEKTLDSLDAKLTKLKTEWQNFIMGIANSDLVKGFIDFGSKLLETINNVIDKLSGGNGLAKSILSVAAAFGVFKVGGMAVRGILNNVGMALGTRAAGSAGIGAGLVGMKQNFAAYRQVIHPFAGVGQKGKDRIQDKGLESYGSKTGGRYNRAAVVSGQAFAVEERAAYEKKSAELALMKSKGQDAWVEQAKSTGRLTGKETADEQAAAYQEAIDKKQEEVNTAKKEVDTATTQQQTAQLQAYGAALQGIGMAAGIAAGALFLLANHLEQSKKYQTLAKIAKGLAIGLSVLSVSFMLLGTAAQIAGAMVAAGAKTAETAIKNIPIIGWILAIISAIISLIAIIREVTKQKPPEEVWKEFEEECEKAKEQAEEVQKSFKELQDSINDIDAKQAHLKELTYGTEQWNTAVQELNQSILNLISIYPALADAVKWVNDHLELDTQSEAYKEWYEQQKRTAHYAGIVSISASQGKDLKRAEENIYNTFKTSPAGGLYSTGTMWKKRGDSLLYENGKVNFGLTSLNANEMRMGYNSVVTPKYFATAANESNIKLTHDPVYIADQFDKFFLAELMGGELPFVQTGTAYGKAGDDLEEPLKNLYDKEKEFLKELGLDTDTLKDFYRKVASPLQDAINNGQITSLSTAYIWLEDWVDDKDKYANIPTYFKNLWTKDGVWDEGIPLAKLLQGLGNSTETRASLTGATKGLRLEELERLGIDEDYWQSYLVFGDKNFLSEYDKITQKEIENNRKAIQPGTDKTYWANYVYARQLEKETGIFDDEEVMNKYMDQFDLYLRSALAVERTYREDNPAFQEFKENFNRINKDTNGVANLVISGRVTELTIDQVKNLKDLGSDDKQFLERYSGLKIGDKDDIDKDTIISSYNQMFKGLNTEVKEEVESIATTWGEAKNLIYGYGRAEAIDTGEKDLSGKDFLDKMSQVYDLVNAANLDEDKEKQAKNILSTIDWSNADSINTAINELDELGVVINQVLVKDIITAVGAISKFNEKTMEEKVKTTETARTAGDKIREDKKTFSASEYEALETIAKSFYGANWNNDWVQTGLDEWVYIGNETNALLSSIDAGVAGILDSTIQAKYKEKERGIEIDKILHPEKYTEEETPLIGGAAAGGGLGMPGRLNIDILPMVVGDAGGGGVSSTIPVDYQYKYTDENNNEKSTTDIDEFIRLIGNGTDYTKFNTDSLRTLGGILKIKDFDTLDPSVLFGQLQTILDPYIRKSEIETEIVQLEGYRSIILSQMASEQELLNRANTYDENGEKTTNTAESEQILQGRVVEQELLYTSEEMRTQAIENAPNGQLLYHEGNVREMQQLTNAANALALAVQKDVDNIDNLNSVLADNWQTFKKATPGTAAYTAALNKLLPALRKVFGEKVDSKWVTEQTKWLDKWVQGGDAAEEAMTHFAEMASKELEGTLPDAIKTTNNDLINLNEHMAELDGSQLEVGGTANFGSIDNALQMTQEKALATAASLSSIPGMEVEWVKTGEVTVDGVPMETGYFLVHKTGAAGSGAPSGGGGGGGGKEFKNDFDKYYNMVEDINELMRLRNLLETDYQQLLESESASGKAIYDNLKKQVDLLKERRDITADLAEKRKGQIFDLINDEENADLTKYAWWNEKDQTIEIDWDAINEIKDSELGDRVKEFVSKLEDFQGKYDEQIEALEDIESTLQEIEKRGRDQYTSLEDRVRDALIQQIQTQIDELTAVNEGISDANQKLFDSIQNTLELQRQERDNAKTEEELSDREQRLAYLQQDSSGANAVEIAQLQKELEDARESYTDQLIDQKISELQKQNDEAAEQRQEQIDLLQQSLDWQEKNGEFWEQAYQLMNNGIGPDGTLVTGSELEQLLKQGEGWQALSAEGKMNWLSDLETMVAEAVGYLYLSRQLEKIGTKAGTEITFTDAEGNTHTGKVDKDGNVVIDNGDGTQTVWKDVYQSYDGSYRTLETEENAKTENKPTTSTGGGGGTGGNTGKKTGKDWSIEKSGSQWVVKSTPNKGQYATEAEAKSAAYEKNKLEKIWGTKLVNGRYSPYLGGGSLTFSEANSIASDLNAGKNVITPYATGGLNTKTGPAWLDGTKSHPELVLNARDTENFIQLKDTLADLRKNSASLGINGDNYYEISINVDEIGSDYDVDKLADRLRTLIYRDSQYRNVNTLNRLR